MFPCGNETAMRRGRRKNTAGHWISIGLRSTYTYTTDRTFGPTQN